MHFRTFHSVIQFSWFELKKRCYPQDLLMCVFLFMIYLMKIEIRLFWKILSCVIQHSKFVFSFCKNFYLIKIEFQNLNLYEWLCIIHGKVNDRSRFLLPHLLKQKNLKLFQKCALIGWIGVTGLLIGLLQFKRMGIDDVIP